jgi:hypothetical protein
LAYTGLPQIDGQLCGLVAFFHILMDPHNLPFNVELFTFLAGMITIPYFEAARENRNILLESQWVIGIMYQKFTGGVVLPMYWLLFIVTGAATLHHTFQGCNNGTIDQRHAESIILALVVGFILPSLAMFITTDQYVTAFWQAFPIWMYIAQLLYLTIRPASHTSGVSTVNFTYIALFILSALPHLYLLTPILFSPNAPAIFKYLFLPSLTVLDPDSTTIDQGVMDVIKWDYMIMLVGAFAVTVWVVGRSVKSIVGLIAWWVVSVLLFGAGASVVGVFWWRERCLNEGGKESEPRDEKRTQ